MDSNDFRDVIGRFASGVTVITARADGVDHGMTASAVASLSLDPPMVLACLNRGTGTHDAVARSRTFAVNILGEDQEELAERFGGRRADKFAGVAIRRGRREVPVLADALAAIECEVSEAVDGATHGVFMARAVRAEAREGPPLTYFRGMFGRFEGPRDEAVYQDLRERILNRRAPVGEPVAVEAVAEHLRVARHEAHHALARLAAEGLVARVAAQRFEVGVVDAASLRQVFEARCALELGAADRTVGRASAAELAELRRRMEDTARWVVDGRVVDQDAYLEANDAFHEYLIELAGNETLVGLYRRLSAKGLMARTMTGRWRADRALVDDHRALVEAYERGDLAAARDVIERHSELGTRLGIDALRAAGGSA